MIELSLRTIGAGR